MTTLNDLLITTPDLNQERLQTLKDLFPDLFSDEGNLKAEELRRIVDSQVAPTKERYEITWNGKARAKRFAFEPSLAALVYDPDRSVNPDKADGNIIIEGENLEVLKQLLAAYRGQVKCIYIDPPYNIDGDHIYRDNETQEQQLFWEETGVTENGVRMDTVSRATGRYHSVWMSIIYSRLLLARHLLRKDGVIFVSIDDNELPNLLKVMEDVFGAENFAAQFAWQSRESMQNDTDISVNHEYVVAFARNRRRENRRLKPSNTERWYSQEDFVFYPLPVDPNNFSNPDDDPRGPWKLDPFDAPNVRPNLTYKIANPTTGSEYWPPRGRCWRTEEAKFQALLADGRIMFGQRGDSAPKLKVFYEDVKDFGTVDNTWLEGSRVGTATKGTQEIQAIFGAAYFDTAKPTALIEKLLLLATRDNDIVLDFFAGSGTTAQAVLNLNRDHGGSRRFILVQFPEQIEDQQSLAYQAGYRQICAMTIERVKRVIEGYGAEPKPFPDSGFKVYRLTKSHFPRAEFTPNPNKTEAENVELLRQYIAEKESSFLITFDHEKILDEVLLKLGFKLTYTVEGRPEFEHNDVRFVQDDRQSALLCLDPSIAEETVDYFKTHPDTLFICLERALDTTKKWNLQHALGDRLKAV